LSGVITVEEWADTDVWVDPIRGRGLQYNGNSAFTGHWRIRPDAQATIRDTIRRQIQLINFRGDRPTIPVIENMLNLALKPPLMPAPAYRTGAQYEGGGLKNCIVLVAMAPVRLYRVYTNNYAKWGAWWSLRPTTGQTRDYFLQTMQVCPSWAGKNKRHAISGELRPGQIILIGQGQEVKCPGGGRDYNAPFYPASEDQPQVYVHESRRGATEYTTTEPAFDQTSIDVVDVPVASMVDIVPWLSGYDWDKYPVDETGPGPARAVRRRRLRENRQRGRAQPG